MKDIIIWCDNICKEIIKELGIGHKEIVYHKAFLVELRKTDYSWESERTLPITYKGVQIGTLRSDIVINDMVVLEFKAITRKMNDNDMLQLHKYLHCCPSFKYGILVNFCGDDIEIKHVE